ncbi:hypothetical protein CI105_05515 [Candidatus Izimaplasma bacterium ZiA1]|uniref:DUF4185 domain-containing protein n=1 Tax=Candidatus Izimoplasma sp. ZiA1 TaxID=2024899 RepID=UPI000BAA8D4B|nr:hypothetical protein CI105_05515 [Candidatus Izimaplasma bacterium ZiA1]
MTKYKNTILIIVLLLVLSGCKKTETPIIEDPLKDLVNISEVETCYYELTNYFEDEIVIEDINTKTSTITGSKDNFKNICKDKTSNPLIFSDSSLKSYSIEFTLDAIYPLKALELTNYLGDDTLSLKTIDIELSLDGFKFDKVYDDLTLNNQTLNEITLNNNMAKKIRISFKNEIGIGNYGGDYYAINDLRVILGEGVIVKEDEVLSNAFLRYSGWSGADGIFSFNLTNGNDTVGAVENTTGFVFSDTFIGNVNEETLLRSNFSMINNTFGYLNTGDVNYENMEFDYDLTTNNIPKSIFLPDDFIGYDESNIINNIGLDFYNTSDALLTNIGNGNMWLSSETTDQEIIFDLKDIKDVTDIYIWNYNDETKYGVKNINIKSSVDGITYIDVSSEVVLEASGELGSEYSNKFTINQTEIRYLKLELLSNYEETTTHYGIGKVMLFNNDDFIYPSVNATSRIEEITGTEHSSRLWIQDGVVIDDYLYLYPILVKDYEMFFKVFKTGIIQVPIVDERLDYDNLVYYDANLRSVSEDGGDIFYGAGVLNMSENSGYTNPDGYIYVYGYKDLHGRNLTVSRVLPEDILDMNKYEYFNGTTFTKNINDSAPLIEGVSAELSVTYMEEGMFAGKYVLVVMENTTSGVISYSLSDTPYGPFTDYVELYKTNESSYLDAFTYNAKMHPSLSEVGNYLISYNVNTTNAFKLSNADIYRPRFIRVIEVKKH